MLKGLHEERAKMWVALYRFHGHVIATKATKQVIELKSFNAKNVG